MEKLNFVDRFTRTITFKFIMVGLISLILLIPVSWVKGLILEREQRSEEVFTEISSIWGNEQKISGPWLTIPYVDYEIKNGESVMIMQNMHFLPEDLSVEAKLKPEIRYRGIFKVVVYSSEVVISGEFKKPVFPSSKIGSTTALWDKARLTLGITDMRGIRNDVDLNWNGTKMEIIPGLQDNDLAGSGFHCDMNLDTAGNEPMKFSTILELNGTKSFNVFPLGKTTHVSIHSSLPSGIYRRVSPD